MIIDITGMMIGCENKSEPNKKTGKDYEFCRVLIDTKEEKNNVLEIRAKKNDPLITARLGDEVKAECYLNSRFWEGGDKYFLALVLAKMTVISSPLEAVDSETLATEISKEADKAFEQTGDNSALPF